MEEQELNKKLAEWAGYNVRAEYEGGFHLFKTPQRPSPDGIHYDDEEFEENWYSGFCTDYFTQSLDACFKWLVPKLEHKSVELIAWAGEPKFECVIVTIKLNKGITGEEIWSEAETPALALCKAIEKLIDTRAE